MKHTLQLHYPHTDQARLLRDVRYHRAPDITREQCYFLGFRISTETSYRYHDALILADDYEAILEGVVEEFNEILDHQAVSSPRDIALVFVRNMMLQDPVKIKKIGYDHIQAEIQGILSKRDDEKFSVFGKAGDDTLMTPVITRDALATLRIVRYKCATKILKNFMPLEICQAHPVRAEFEVLFQEAARQVMLLIDAKPGEHTYLQ